MPIDERRFAALPAAAHALADDLADLLRRMLEDRGDALLAVAGGRTPRHVFARLRTAVLDWRRVTITLTDERWVPADHPDSNEHLVRTYLLQDRAAPATFVPLFGGERTPEEGREACEARLAPLPLPFDAVYLGLGPEGHVASLFPGDPAVAVRGGRCVAVPARGGRVARMSLTAPTLLSARQAFLLFDGKDKQRAYGQAKRPGPADAVPARLLLRQDTVPVTVFSAP